MSKKKKLVKTQDNIKSKRIKTDYISQINFDSNLKENKLTIFHKITLIVSYLTIFILYFVNVSPSVPSGDSGEFITSSVIMGIPHPPGYPLYMILSKLFSMIPFGEIAWRINLLSSVFNITASIILFFSLFKLMRCFKSSLIASIFFSLSPLIWEYSLKAEVFPLNNLFISIIIYLLVSMRKDILFDKKVSLKSIFALFFISGLSLTNHHTIILFAFPVLLWLYFYLGKAFFNPKIILASLIFFILALSVYIYIPIRALETPFLNWDNPKNLENFITLVTRSDYGTFRLMSVKNAETYNLIEKYGIYIFSLIKHFNPIGFLLGVFGIIFLIIQKDKILGRILIFSYILLSFLFIAVANFSKESTVIIGIFERFFMSPSIFFSIFIGCGIYYLTNLIPSFFKKNINVLKIIFLSAIVLSILISSIINFQSIRKQNYNKLTYNFGKNILNSLEKDSILLTKGDILINPINYLQIVEKIRPDVIVLDQNMLSKDWYCTQMKGFYPNLVIPFKKYIVNESKIVDVVNPNYKKRSIYIVNPIDSSIEKDYKYLSSGVVKKIISKDFINSYDFFSKYYDSILKSYDLTGIYQKYDNSSFEKEITRYYSNLHYSNGFEYDQLNILDHAEQEYKEAIKIDENNSYPYKKLGILYYLKKNNPKESVKYFEPYLKLNSKDEKASFIQSIIDKNK